MNKAHSPINWQNKPSVNTPINETNLNKMDSTIGILDDRIIAHDTSKLDKSTANTMVKDVTFNESTGIFTITYLNGSTKTLDTKLEKIATNFKYDYSTQTLILTLIDGTTQSIDMSALLTQYEFTDSATLDFSVDSSGKITATIKNGSITEDMLEPNYLANIKVEVAKAENSATEAEQSATDAKTSETAASASEKNAKTSETNAKTYATNASNSASSASTSATNASASETKAEKSATNASSSETNAKTSENNASNSANLAKSYAVGGTGTRDGEDTDNAKYYSENAKPVAQTITGTNPTATNSTHAPLIYGKIKGYTLQEGEPTPDNPIDIQGLGDSGTIEVKTCGKNLIDLSSQSTQAINGVTATPNEDGSITVSGTATGNAHLVFDDVIPKMILGEVYTFCLNNTETILSCNVYLQDSRLIAGMGYSGLIDNPPYRTVIQTLNTSLNQLVIFVGNGVTYDFTIYPQLEEGTVATSYEPYTETTATIPIDTLYEGDYLEVYADGSGKIASETRKVDGNDNWYDDGWIGEGYRYSLPIFHKGLNSPLYSTHYKQLNASAYHVVGDYIENQESTSKISVRTTNTELSDTTKFKAWMLENNVYVLIQLATPTETPLTAEQVQAFKQLYTFDNVTNFFCDGELTARYYCNTDSGDTVGMIQETVDGLQKTVKEIPDTYTTQSDFDRIVGGTVRDSGLTNVSYIVPNEISDGSMSFDSYTGGTLVAALRKATNQITMFLGTLFEEGDKSVVFENDSVAGTLEVFRHKLSEGTYLLDIKVTITSITETLSGNGPSVDLTLQDIGFEDNIIAIRESECLLASYYPLIVNGSSYCLGGGMVSTENSTKGFYLRFLPHKNTKGSISSNNKSVLSGTMMIKVVEQQL